MHDYHANLCQLACVLYCDSGTPVPTIGTHAIPVCSAHASSGAPDAQVAFRQLDIPTNCHPNPLGVAVSVFKAENQKAYTDSFRAELLSGHLKLQSDF